MARYSRYGLLDGRTDARNFEKNMLHSPLLRRTPVEKGVTGNTCAVCLGCTESIPSAGFAQEVNLVPTVEETPYLGGV